MGLMVPYRDFIKQEDLTRAARKVAEAKKHESKSPPNPAMITSNLSLTPFS